jgi:hypothetical protein
VNKQQFIEKCSWKKLLRLRPIPRRYNGNFQGQELPALDRAWQVGQATIGGGVPIDLHETGHGMVLNWDNIVEYSSDPIRGERYGYLHLKVQLHIAGDQIRSEPLVWMRH